MGAKSLWLFPSPAEVCYDWAVGRRFGSSEVHTKKDHELKALEEGKAQGDDLQLSRMLPTICL
jgi:hypothetical protein